MTDLQEAEHVARPYFGGREVCDGCGQFWPCRTELQRRLAATMSLLNESEALRHAMRQELAKALARIEAFKDAAVLLGICLLCIPNNDGGAWSEHAADCPVPETWAPAAAEAEAKP
jgi:hypothetical protein